MSESVLPSVVSDAVLDVAGLGKAYGKVGVFSEVSLRLGRGEMAVLTGANGAGKSTLLECLAGAQPFDVGQVVVQGVRRRTTDRAHWREVHAILDDFAWFPDLSVADHLRLLAPRTPFEDLAGVAAQLGAEDLLDRLPATLSSGQRQRCALVSAGVREWSVLLVDEPERHLDADSVPAVVEYLSGLAGRGAVIVASHHRGFTQVPGVRRWHLEHGRLVERE